MKLKFYFFLFAFCVTAFCVHSQESQKNQNKNDDVYSDTLKIKKVALTTYKIKKPTQQIYG
jgi:hypothetical protein